MTLRLPVPLNLSWLACATGAACSQAVWAATPPAVVNPQELTPSAPPQMTVQSLPTHNFRCERQFKYQGRLLNCDSHLMADGENLRPILRDTPEAISELDIYQANRASLENLAYIGTFGVASALAGIIVSKQYEHPQSQLVRNVGLGVCLLTVGYVLVRGFTSINANQDHLINAVKLHNTQHPDRPIELLLNKTFTF